MKRDVLRTLARERWPVVKLDSGTVDEIVYPQIREIKAVYASPEELRKGFPRERLAVVLGDRSGHSYTEVGANQLRLPTNQEAAEFCLNRSADAVAKMCAGLDELRGMEEL